MIDIFRIFPCYPLQIFEIILKKLIFIFHLKSIAVFNISIKIESKTNSISNYEKYGYYKNCSLHIDFNIVFMKVFVTFSRLYYSK